MSTSQVLYVLMVFRTKSRLNAELLIKYNRLSDEYYVKLRVMCKVGTNMNEIIL